MDWGMMQGLGDGLQALGGRVMDMNKDKLREKLKIEEEARQERRLEAREERQRERKLKEVAETDYAMVDGKLMKQYKNHEDSVLRMEPADQSAMDKWNRQETKEKNAISLSEFAIKKAEREERQGGIEDKFFEENERLDVEGKRALIKNRELQYDYTQPGRTSGGRRSIDDSVTGGAGKNEAIQELNVMFKDQKAQYVKGTKDKPADMSAAEWDRLVDDVVSAVAKRGPEAWKNTPTAFRKALQQYLTDKRRLKDKNKDNYGKD